MNNEENKKKEEIESALAAIAPARNQNTKTEQEFHNKAESVLAFYLTSDEIA